MVLQLQPHTGILQSLRHLLLKPLMWDNSSFGFDLEVLARYVYSRCLLAIAEVPTDVSETFPLVVPVPLGCFRVFSCECCSELWNRNMRGSCDYPEQVHMLGRYVLISVTSRKPFLKRLTLLESMPETSGCWVPTAVASV